MSSFSTKDPNADPGNELVATRHSTPYLAVCRTRCRLRVFSAQEVWPITSIWPSAGRAQSPSHNVSKSFKTSSSMWLENPGALPDETSPSQSRITALSLSDRGVSRALNRSIDTQRATPPNPPPCNRSTEILLKALRRGTTTERLVWGLKMILGCRCEGWVGLSALTFMPILTQAVCRISCFAGKIRRWPGLVIASRLRRLVFVEESATHLGHRNFYC